MASSMRFTKVCVLLALMLILLLVAALPVSAAEIKVDGNCTLRNAIKSANDDKSRNNCEAGDGDDVIIMKRDSKPGTGQLEMIRSTITIEGLGNMLEVDNAHSVFKIDGGDLTVRNLKVIYHDNTRERKSFEVYDGSLTLIDVTVENCEVGIQRENSHVSLQGNTNICDLPQDQLVFGTGTSDFNLPVVLPPDTCSALPGANTAIAATYGQRSGVQCRQLDGSGIGVQSIIDAGFISAVDVWGYVEQGVEICFPQLGSITFLDAATSPRTVSTLDSYSRGNSTCVHLTRAGAVVLMAGAPTSVSPAATVAQPDTATSVVDGCGVHALGHLKFLADPAPDGEIIGYIRRGATVTFVSRILGWYQVSHGGLTGWVGGKYARANC